jgi:hypothetical protein
MEKANFVNVSDKNKVTLKTQLTRTGETKHNIERP